MDRRGALGAMAAGLVAAGAGGAPDRGEDGQSAGGMTYRTLGKTGEKVSAIGLGGFHIGFQSDPQESIRIVRYAIDHGITFMDNCWDYNGGESEKRMGQALRDGYRQKVFLMTKFDGRTKAATAQQIDESLARLETDHIDLIQYHENIRLEDPDRFFAPGGALEALMAAKQAGKIRYIGFTGHKDPIVHLRMLDEAQQHKFHFDSCQMPLNVMDAHFRSFAHQVVPRLVAEGVGVLGMKPMGDGNVLRSGVVAPIECLHYALNLPTSVVINGCESVDRVNQALEAARTFKPMTEAQVSSLLARTKAAAMTGRYEPFKTTSDFDGTASHPQWLG
ncbi:MAG TPA: aldo/keto reductase [Terriglobia bacterium]|nr:aldo/keto reductase [Terriglobia bacterium]